MNFDINNIFFFFLVSTI